MIFTILTFFLFIFSVQPIYTNSDALECFNTKAVDVCASEFAECLVDAQCSEELKKYNKCSFGTSEDEGSHVYNGYCFRRWEQKAQHTKRLIKCFRESCQLDYNSEIGVKQLFLCAQWIMFDNKFECQDACQTQMQKIGKNLYTLPLSELYGATFENEQAQNLVNLIRKSCIQEGEGKQMIYEEEKLREERESGRQQRNPQKSAENDIERAQL